MSVARYPLQGIPDIFSEFLVIFVRKTVVRCLVPLKGLPKQIHKLVWWRFFFLSANVSICRLPMVVVSTCLQQKYFFPQISVPEGAAAMLLRSWLIKSRKRSVHDVMYISAAHAGFAYDVTYTDDSTYSGVACVHVFVTLYRRLFTNFTTNNPLKNGSETPPTPPPPHPPTHPLAFFLFFYFTFLIGRAQDVSSICGPHNVPWP